MRKQFPRDRLLTLILNGKGLGSLETDSFDFITVYSVLHNITDYLAALSELARVCKPGGVIYLDHEPSGQFWSDDHIDWQCIEDTLTGLGFEVFCLKIFSFEKNFTVLTYIEIMRNCARIRD